MRWYFHRDRGNENNSHRIIMERMRTQSDRGNGERERPRQDSEFATRRDGNDG